MMDDRSVLTFLFELGQLRRIKHEGWRLAGIEHPDSVAEHSLRAAQIGFVLAVLEGFASPETVAAMLVFHDVGECRVGDIHKVANRYTKVDEEGAVRDQTTSLDTLGQKIFDLWLDVEERKTQAGLIAKDADYLEQALLAKEYMEHGHMAAEDWIHNIQPRLRTESAKRLIALLSEVGSTDWWRGLKKLEKTIE